MNIEDDDLEGIDIPEEDLDEFLYNPDDESFRDKWPEVDPTIWD